MLALNKLFARLELAESRMLLLALFIMLSLCSTVMRFTTTPDPFMMSDGSHPFWLVFMYLVGAHVKKFGRPFEYSRLLAAAVFLVCTFIMVLTGWFMNQSPLFFYTSPTVVVQSLCLLVIFAHSDPQPGEFAARVIRLLSSLSFSVYLFQLHPLIWERLLAGRFAQYGGLSTPSTILLILGISLLLYLGGSAVDLVRYALFKLLKIK